MKKLLRILLFILSGLVPGYVAAQQIALKSNLLYDATTTINLGLEVALSRRWTLDVSGNLNPWSFSENKKFKHWMVQPELRRWNCEKFSRGFWGVHLLGGQYNVGNVRVPFGLFSSLREERVQGWMAGLGISYGYQWYLGPHWNLEATVGVGYIYTRYDVYECPWCGRSLGRRHHNYWGPTRIGVSIVYLFNHKKY